jgi:hypothetical protein
MDGGRKAAKLEVHVRVWNHASVAFGLLVAATAARAQHYSIIVGMASSRQMLLLDFSPCIPAEGSGCGGFLTRPVDAGKDSAFAVVVPTYQERSARNSNGGISIAGDMIVLTTGDGARADAAQERQIVDPQRTPIAVAAAPGSRYAFALLAAKRGDAKAQVRMFDLATRTAVASLLIDGVPSGIANLR